MDMAFSGMDKDERQASGTDFWEGVDCGKKFGLVQVYSYEAPAMKNA